MTNESKGRLAFNLILVGLTAALEAYIKKNKLK